MVSYFALFEPDRRAGGYVVTFPDLGHGATQGETMTEARAMARDLLKCILAELIKRGHPLPAARAHRGKNFQAISLPALESAKAELYLAFQKSGIRKAEFARRVGIPKANVERLFDLDHASRLGQMERAFEAVGKKLELLVSNAA